MKKRVLVIGASGLLGSNWMKFPSPSYEAIGTIHKRSLESCSSLARKLDFNDHEYTKRLIQNENVKIVVNCAGLTNIELCEENPGLAFDSNVSLPSKLARSCAETDIKFIHISTDHVFSGEVGNYEEGDPTKPVNVYADTKLKAEHNVLVSCPTALILRTNFFGWGPDYRRSFSDLIITSLRAGKEVSLFNDAFFSPIFIRSLIEYAYKLAELNLKGIYHVSSSERISKYDFGIMIAESFGLNKALVKQSSLLSRNDLVPRAFDLSLNNAKLCNALGINAISVGSELVRLRGVEL